MSEVIAEQGFEGRNGINCGVVIGWVKFSDVFVFWSEATYLATSIDTNSSARCFNSHHGSCSSTSIWQVIPFILMKNRSDCSVCDSLHKLNPWMWMFIFPFMSIFSTPFYVHTLELIQVYKSSQATASPCPSRRRLGNFLSCMSKSSRKSSIGSYYIGSPMCHIHSVYSMRTVRSADIGQCFLWTLSENPTFYLVTSRI